MSQKYKALWGALFGALAGSVVAIGSLSPAFDTRGLAGVFDRLRIPALGLDDALDGHWYFYLASVGAWALFGLYWDLAAKNANAAKESESTGSRSVHVILVSVAQFLIFVPI